MKDEVVTLFQRVNVAGNDRFIPFEQRILWLREASTQRVLRWDDKIVIDEIGTWSDGYLGYLRSLERAIAEDAAYLAKKYKLSTSDRLSVDLDVKITERAVLECDDAEAKEDERRYVGQEYRKAYYPVGREDQWYTSDVAAGDRFPRFQAERTYFEQAGFYSTRRHVIGEVPAELAAWIAEERAKAKEAGKSNRKAVAL